MVKVSNHKYFNSKISGTIPQMDTKRPKSNVSDNQETIRYKGFVSHVERRETLAAKRPYV